MAICKGIILAGGKATRLFPATVSVCKQLLPIYDKPMIYYPLSTLMISGIKDILIITRPEDSSQFCSLLGDGSQWGINISYEIQEKPRGLADAFLVGESFIGNDDVALILGDNIFYGEGLSNVLMSSAKTNDGATVFAYYVKDPCRYGIVEFDENMKAVSIEEKPLRPKSNYAITGLYYYNNEVVSYAKKIKPSNRGEIEITDINSLYLKQDKLKVNILGRGMAWLDTGTHDSLLEASNFVSTIEKRQGLKISCLEEIALRKDLIDKDNLIERIKMYENTSYGDYLMFVLENYERYISKVIIDNRD